MIRTATPNDAPPVALLLEQLGYPAQREVVRARLEQQLADPTVGVLVASSDGRVVGLATFHILQLIYRSQPQCRITALVVDARHRRGGIGSALIESVEQTARARGCFRLELTTRHGRPEAMRFYTAIGFGERRHRLVKELDRH